MNCPTYVLDFSKKLRRIPWSNKFGKYYILYLSIQCNNAISISKLKYTNTHTQITFFKPALVSLTGFPCGSDGRESACSAGDLGSIPGSGRSLGEGNGYPLQYSCLENSMDRGAWWVTKVHVVAKALDTTDQLTLSLFSLHPTTYSPHPFL